jgi:hypothetical protein
MMEIGSRLAGSRKTSEAISAAQLFAGSAASMVQRRVAASAAAARVAKPV